MTLTPSDRRHGLTANEPVAYVQCFAVHDPESSRSLASPQRQTLVIQGRAENTRLGLRRLSELLPLVLEARLASPQRSSAQGC